MSTRKKPNCEDSPELRRAARRRVLTIDVSPHHQSVEARRAVFRRPLFLYSILLLVGLWVLPNVLPRRNGIPPRFNPPPFNWLERTIVISSLLMTTGVLIKQNRQEKLAKQRAQLSLQRNLVSQQKIAKIIALVEELHYNLPNVKERPARPRDRGDEASI